MFDDWGLESLLNTDTGSFTMPSGYYDPSFDFNLDLDPYSYFTPDYDTSFLDPSFGFATSDPTQYGFSDMNTSLSQGSPLLGAGEILGYAPTAEEETRPNVLGDIFGKTKDFINGKGNMSTLLTLATLASMGQKPKPAYNATGTIPSSVAATEIYNKFTPTQQANMESFAAKKNLMPLAQQFDPRMYGYGGEIKFFDREA